VEEGDDTSVVQNDLTVLARNRLPPPLVVDAPPLADDRDPAGGLAREADVNRLSVLVGADVDRLRLAEGLEPRSVRRRTPIGAHGSKLRRA
jgi:hypothetical protein